MFEYTDDNVFQFFKTDEDDVREIVWEAVSFLDFLKMANTAWFNGGSFDVDEKILAAADTSAPIKILQRDSFFPDPNNHKKELLVIWGDLKMRDGDISVPVRFFALPKDFKSAVTEYRVDESVRAINLSSYIEYLEALEEDKWANLLG